MANMKLEISLNNISRSPVQKRFLKTVAKKTIEALSLKYLRKKNISVSFALVPEREMKRINKTYRGKNAVTDVLSFSEYKNAKEIKKETSGDIFLGEMILCYNFIAGCAKKNSVSVKEELAIVTAHGLLHLLGMRHGKKMFAMQDNIYLLIYGKVAEI